MDTKTFYNSLSNNLGTLITGEPQARPKRPILGLLAIVFLCLAIIQANQDRILATGLLIGLFVIFSVLSGYLNKK